MKTYIQPEIKLLSLSNTPIMAASITGSSVYNTDANSDDEVLSKPNYFVSDDEEDEWENEWGR